MTKDLAWTNNNREGHQTIKDNNDEGHLKLDKYDTKPTQDKSTTIEWDKVNRNLTEDNVAEKEKQNDQNKTRRETQDKIFEIHEPQEKKTEENHCQIKKLNNDNTKVTIVRKLSKTKSSKFDNDIGQYENCIQTNKSKSDTTNINNSFSLKKDVVENPNLILNYFLLYTSTKKNFQNTIKFGGKFRLLVIIFVLVPSAEPFTIKEKLQRNITVEIAKKLETTEDIDYDKTTKKSNSTTKTPCICPTTQHTNSSGAVSTPATSSPSTSECACQDIIENLAEVETSTNIASTNIRRRGRRRRKEVGELGLFVDKFDEKILKKMPFLEFD